MKRLTLSTTLVLVLTGCSATLPQKPEIVYVDKIVTKECPAPPELSLPKLYTDQLSDQDKEDSGKVVQLYKATVKQLMGAVQERDAIIDGYRKNNNDNTRNTNGSK